MKKYLITSAAAVAVAFVINAQEQLPVPPIATPWSETVTPDNVWQQYPRPMMARQQWKNLNGEWDYAILPVGSATPAEYDGTILVPFPVESYLSGVGRTVGNKNELWYRRCFTVPAEWTGEHVNLNFGGIDWQADVWVNDVLVGSHKGAYSPFSLDITEALVAGDNKLTVRVFDPTDKGTQPRGKQVIDPENVRPKGIWYTPVTGIWQTVWLEPVPANSIRQLRITPDVDRKRLTVSTATTGDGIIKVEVMDNGNIIAVGSGKSALPVEIDMPEDMKLWWPGKPYIYDLRISLIENGATVDSVDSYAAMRKVGMKRGKDKVKRFTINDIPIFHFGPLDQGWWPDGLYTPPSYEAMIYDIDKTIELGFNMIRKHIKVEPQLWYEYCDRNGIMVWQDMPSGDKNTRWENHNYYKSPEYERSAESAAQYRAEWNEIMDNLHSHPSIVVWVPFNEGWGQFDTRNIAEWTKKKDPSRLVNAASGGNFFYGAGDILDVHNYPSPRIYLLDDDKVNVIGEYGGIGYPIKGHLWQPDRNWGYIQFRSPDEVTDKYLEYIDILDNMSTIVYSGAVYTQTTDVEGEVNGLLTYDRKKIKVDARRVSEANRRLISTHSRH